MKTYRELLAVALIAAVCVLGTTAATQAAPVTLAFEAEVTALSVGVPYDSGVVFSVGDIITGKLEYEYDSSTAMTLTSFQPHVTTVMVNGTLLESLEHETQVVNDSPIADFPPASLIDSVRIFSGPLRVSHSDNQTVVDADSSGLRFTLFGTSSTLSSAAIPQTVEQWNSFSLRRQLSLSLRNGSGGVVGFGATVREFTVVPEPSSLVTALIASTLLVHLSNSRS